jgi:hypothetical protein
MGEGNQTRQRGKEIRVPSRVWSLVTVEAHLVLHQASVGVAA